MPTHSFLSTLGKLCRCSLPLALALMTIPSAAQNNTFSGTYTFVTGSVNELQIQTNMFGQEVGFCPNGPQQLPFGYSCNQVTLSQDVLTGTLIADGAGNIITGSNAVYTPDVNSNKCSSKYNATPDCPYKVPSGIAWSSSVSYVVGDEVDFTVGGKLLTFQAVTNNTNVAPNTSTCTATIQPPACAWDQLNISATGKTASSATITGKYTVQSNGSAVAQLNVVTTTGKMSIAFAMVVPSTPLAIGQVVPFATMPVLGNEFRGSGGAVRVK